MLSGRRMLEEQGCRPYEGLDRGPAEGRRTKADAARKEYETRTKLKHGVKESTQGGIVPANTGR